MGDMMSNANPQNLDKKNIGFMFSFSINVTEIISNKKNRDGFGFNKKPYNPMKIKHKRPTFKHRKITKFVGLRNEGATCYMNSMLQTLHHIAALRRNVYKIPVGHEAEQKKKAELLEKARKKKAEEGDKKK